MKSNTQWFAIINSRVANTLCIAFFQTLSPAHHLVKGRLRQTKVSIGRVIAL